MTKEQLIDAVKTAKAAHDAAVKALSDFENDPTQHVYASLDEAEGYLEETLRDRAHADCEGSYNCGDDEYRQGFYVDGVEYVAIASVEYNRHDKTYYYVDGFDLKIEKV